MLCTTWRAALQTSRSAGSAALLQTECKGAVSISGGRCCMPPGLQDCTCSEAMPLYNPAHHAAALGLNKAHLWSSAKARKAHPQHQWARTRHTCSHQQRQERLIHNISGLEQGTFVVISKGKRGSSTTSVGLNKAHLWSSAKAGEAHPQHQDRPEEDNSTSVQEKGRTA
eukprot:1161746-Pelagomonas_calceolata.AAC.3